MSEHMSTELALDVIDRHVIRRPADSLRSSRGTKASRARAPAVLPAFHVGGWREGPSPFDLHNGDATCSVDAVWASRQGVAIVDGTTGHAVAQFLSSNHSATAADGSVTAAAPLATALRATVLGDAGCSGRPDYFAGDTHPPTLYLKDSGSATFDLATVRNPARDRLALASVVDTARGRELVRRIGADRSALYAECVRVHPNGALGIRERPHRASAGAVYSAHGRRLQAARAHEARKLLGYATCEPQDHLRGSVIVRDGEPEARQHVAYIAPSDHLFGGVNTN